MAEERRVRTTGRHAVVGPRAAAHAEAGRRPLSARSVVASTLLGMDPPRLRVQLLVRSGQAFGISDGTTRTAISRMVAAGELEPDGDGYRLAGPLLARHQRQRQSRQASRRRWDGRWTMAVVVAEGRTASERADLRAAFRSLHLAELREGVWLRPDNLPVDRAPEPAAVVDEQCTWFVTDEPHDARTLVAELWDLAGWAERASALEAEMHVLEPRLAQGDLEALAPGFVLSADVLRHFVADPLLPAALLPPDWPGDELRRQYDGYDATFTALWLDWYRRQS